MDALPGRLSSDGRETIAALICPDCGGTVAIRIHSRHLDAWRRRARAAREQAARVRAMVDADRPLFFSSGEHQGTDGHAGARVA